MEGIEEPLARMVEGGLRERGGARRHRRHGVARREAVGHLRLMKYQTTERMRRCVNDAFDLHGGRAICDGPSNYLQSAYQMVPVGITVEGANILTRTLITFAQGALRSHPYLYSEIQAAQDTDDERGLDAFDTAFCDHVAFSVSNATGAFFHNITVGIFAPVPEQAYDTAALVPPARARLAQLRLRRRPDGRRARRRTQDQAEDHRAPRRRAVRALPPCLRAEALRGRRHA